MKLVVTPHRRSVVAGSGTPQKLFVTARLLPEKLTGRRMTPAIAVCVDTSGSMYARTEGGVAKIDLAIDAVGDIPRVPGFDAGTEVCLIHFDDDASVLLPLSVLPANAAEVMASHARRLRDFNGGTMMGRALTLGLEQLAQASPNTVRRVIALTDGETGDVGACGALADEAARRGVGLLAVGIGDEYNEDMLVDLAERARGAVAHVRDGEDGLDELRSALRRELSRAQRETLLGAVVRVDETQEARLLQVHQVYPRCQALPPAPDGGWLVGNLAEDDDAVLLLEFEVAAPVAGAVEVATITLSYRDPLGAESTAMSRVAITGTGDAAKARDVDSDVLFFVRQRNVAGLVDKATAASRKGDVEGARKSLYDARRITNMIGHIQMDRKLGAAERELDASGTIAESTRKDMKVASRMGTITMYGPTMRGLVDDEAGD